MSDTTESLREFADALDKDRGHSKSYVTLVMREAADELVAAEAQVRLLTEALSAALDCKGSFNGTVSARGGDPAICTGCEDQARAALASPVVAASESEETT